MSLFSTSITSGFKEETAVKQVFFDSAVYSKYKVGYSSAPRHCLRESHIQHPHFYDSWPEFLSPGSFHILSSQPVCVYSFHSMHAWWGMAHFLVPHKFLALSSQSNHFFLSWVYLAFWAGHFMSLNVIPGGHMSHRSQSVDGSVEVWSWSVGPPYGLNIIKNFVIVFMKMILLWLRNLNLPGNFFCRGRDEIINRKKMNQSDPTNITNSLQYIGLHISRKSSLRKFQVINIVRASTPRSLRIFQNPW